MSVVVAIQKNDEIVIAADTQDNFGSLKVQVDNSKSRKIWRVDVRHPI